MTTVREGLGEAGEDMQTQTDSPISWLLLLNNNPPPPRNQAGSWMSAVGVGTMINAIN